MKNLDKWVEETLEERLAVASQTLPCARRLDVPGPEELATLPLPELVAEASRQLTENGGLLLPKRRDALVETFGLRGFQHTARMIERVPTQENLDMIDAYREYQKTAALWDDRSNRQDERDLVRGVKKAIKRHEKGEDLPEINHSDMFDYTRSGTNTANDTPRIVATLYTESMPPKQEEIDTVLDSKQKQYQVAFDETDIGDEEELRNRSVDVNTDKLSTMSREKAKSKDRRRLNPKVLRAARMISMAGAQETLRHVEKTKRAFEEAATPQHLPSYTKNRIM